MSGEVGNLLRCYSIYSHLLLGNQLTDVVTEFVVVPVRILYKFLAYFCLQLWLDGQTARMCVPGCFKVLS